MGDEQPMPTIGIIGTNKAKLAEFQTRIALLRIRKLCGGKAWGNAHFAILAR